MKPSFIPKGNLHNLTDTTQKELKGSRWDGKAVMVA